MSQPFDAKELLDRVDHDREFLGELVRMLKDEGHRLMHQIRESVSAGDAAGAARAAHALKGMISNFCAPAAHASATAVEQHAKNLNLVALPSTMNILESDLDDLIAALTQFLSESATCES